MNKLGEDGKNELLVSTKKKASCLKEEAKE